MSYSPTLLVVDDEAGILQLVSDIGTHAGFTVITAASGAAALATSRIMPIDVLVVDWQLPDGDGLNILGIVRERHPRCVSVLMTGHPSVENAVRALRLGAVDYLTKPIDVVRLDQLLSAHRTNGSTLRSEREACAAHGRCEHYGMVGTTARMHDVFTAIRRVAPFVTTALITGETGTGKELVARALHATGRRSMKPFVTINCSAVVESLFESELFGHVRGAFTDASDHKPGLFEMADQGVLFLDEIGELPPVLQAKLLRVLETGELQRVGATTTRQVDVVVLAATNRDLRAEMAAGRFRRDLYYRLNLVEICLPALRERREDIPYLVDRFVEACTERFQKPIVGLTPTAESLLQHAPWAGNIRELRNVVEEACLLSDSDTVTEAQIRACLPPTAPAFAAADRPRPPVSRTGFREGDPTSLALLVTVERSHILRVLEYARGNKRQAASALGISRRALYRRLERLGLEGTIVRRSSDGSDSLADTF